MVEVERVRTRRGSGACLLQDAGPEWKREREGAF